MGDYVCKGSIHVRRRQRGGKRGYTTEKRLEHALHAARGWCVYRMTDSIWIGIGDVDAQKLYERQQEQEARELTDRQRDIVRREKGAALREEMFCRLFEKPGNEVIDTDARSRRKERTIQAQKDADDAAELARQQRAASRASARAFASALDCMNGDERGQEVLSPIACSDDA